MNNFKENKEKLKINRIYKKTKLKLLNKLLEQKFLRNFYKNLIWR